MLRARPQALLRGGDASAEPLAEVTYNTLVTGIASTEQARAALFARGLWRRAEGAFRALAGVSRMFEAVSKKIYR